MAKVAVIGAGYVGLVTASCLAHLGHSVVCLEVDERKLLDLKNGGNPIHEPGLDGLLAAGLSNGRLRFSDDYREIANVDFALIAVPTPPTGDGSADTSFVFEAVRSIIPNVRPELVLVVKSTVPVGTGDAIAELGEVREARLEVVSNPEFLRQGTAVRDFLSPDRVVIGAASLQGAVDVARLYSALNAPVVAVSRRSAELAKYTANALLATRISFMNEISHIASAVDADVADVARIVGMDPRIGPSFLKSGLGWGGSCFPKDILALSSIAQRYNCRTPILAAVYEINERQSDHATQEMLRAVHLVPDPVIAILGVAFKPDTDDVRGSPGLAVASRLLAAGVTVRAHDPFAAENASRVMPDVDYREHPYTAVEGADAVLLATEWREYLSLDWALVRETMRGNTIFDGRNALSGSSLAKLGFRYLSFGHTPMNGHNLSLHEGNGDEGGRAWAG